MHRRRRLQLCALFRGHRSQERLHGRADAIGTPAAVGELVPRGDCNAVRIHRDVVQLRAARRIGLVDPRDRRRSVPASGVATTGVSTWRRLHRGQAGACQQRACRPGEGQDLRASPFHLRFACQGPAARTRAAGPCRAHRRGHRRYTRRRCAPLPRADRTDLPRKAVHPAGPAGRRRKGAPRQRIVTSASTPPGGHQRLPVTRLPWAARIRGPGKRGSTPMAA